MSLQKPSPHQGSGRRGAWGSFENLEEVELARTLCLGLVRTYAAGAQSVAVLAPYAAQVARLRAAFEAYEALAHVQVSSIDGFQGREADVVVFSCVRARGQGRGGGSVGFLADVRRQNVALTRARRALWVLGDAATLVNNPSWGAFLHHCRAQGCLLRADRPYEALLRARC